MRVFLTCFRERSESPSCTCHFTHSFNLKCSLYQSVIFWESVFGKYLGKPISHMTDLVCEKAEREGEKMIYRKTHKLKLVYATFKVYFR